MRTKAGLVLFDWNLTLVDDGEVLCRAFNKPVILYGNGEVINLETYYRTIDESSGSIWPLWKSRGVIKNARPTEEEKTKIHDAWNDEYFSHINEIRLAPGAIDALEILHQMNIPMGIVSGHTPKLFKFQMDKFDLWKFFFSPSPAPFGRYRIILIKHDGDKRSAIQTLMRQENPPLHACIYVCDTSFDVMRAHKAGAKTIVYLNHQPKDIFENAKPNYTITHFLELPPLVERLLADNP